MCGCRLSKCRELVRGRHLKAVVRPAAQFEDAGLVVEREVGDIHGARGAKLGRRRPEDTPVVVHHRLAVHVAAGVVVGASEHSTDRCQVMGNYISVNSSLRSVCYWLYYRQWDRNGFVIPKLMVVKK